jgi:maleate cis-trans isomerase
VVESPPLRTAAPTNADDALDGIGILEVRVAAERAEEAIVFDGDAATAAAALVDVDVDVDVDVVAYGCFCCRFICGDGEAGKAAAVGFLLAAAIVVT